MLDRLRWVLRFARSSRRRMAVAVLLASAASGAAIGLSATAAWLIVRASERPPVLHLMVAIVAVRAFGVGRGVLRYGERLAAHDATFRIVGELRVAAVERLAKVLPRPAVEPAAASGGLLARFVDDVEGLQDLWVRVIVPYGSAAIVGAASVLLSGLIVPTTGVLLAVTLLASALLAPTVADRSARRAESQLAPLQAAYQTELLEVLDGATELQVYGVLPERIERLDELDRAMAAAERRTAGGLGRSAAVTALAAGAATWGALWLGAGAVDRGALSGVGLGVVALLPLAAHELFASLAPAGRLLPALSERAGRIRDLLSLKPEIAEPVSGLSPPEGPLGLRVRGLSARWDTDGADVVHDLSFELSAGSAAVLVAPSGAGKSTVAAVLLRFLEPSGGSIEVVGAEGTVELRDLSSDTVRSVIGACLQDDHLFDSTIEANLRIARPDATTEELHAALVRAGLDDWVRTLPDGLATMVGEHGSQLSGGQRQRLSLTRTVLAERSIMVFDEPTEHLDEHAAAALARDLVAAAGGRTLLVITHRPELFPGLARIELVSAG